MKKNLILLTIVALLGLITCQEVKYEENVAVLTDSNFESFISEVDFVLVEFYATWCGHCKSLAPEYAKAATTLLEIAPNVKLAKVEATENELVAQQFEIQGFPTLFFFRKGQKTEYSGPRENQGIVDWIMKKTGPLTTQISSMDDFHKIRSDNDVVIVFFGKDSNQEEFKVHEDLSANSAVDSVLYAHVFDSELKKQIQIDQDQPRLVIFKHFDEQRNDFTSDQKWNSADIATNFVSINIFPSILNFDEAGAEKIFTSEDKGALFVIMGENEASVVASQALDEAKDQLKGEILLCRTKIVDGMGERLGQYLNLSEEDLPKILILNIQDDDMNKFYHTGEVSALALQEFVTEYKQGNLRPTLMSEEIPEQNPDENVVTLVGKNFNDVVTNESHDVLVEFYAPWCGHCQALAPAFEKVATHFKDAQESNIIIAKMDYTKNEVTGMNIEGFPTLKYFIAGPSGKVIDYEGERTEEEIIKFVREYRYVATPEDDDEQNQQQQEQNQQQQQQQHTSDL